MIDDWKHKAHYLFPILSCFTVLSTATAYYLSKTKRRRITLKDHTNCKKYGTIPSPPNKFPIIGHLLSLGKVPSKQVSIWHKEIGPFYQLQMGTKTWIMISDPNIAHEIFVKNSISTFSRPYHTFAVKIYGLNNKGIVFTKYSSKWRCERKAATSVLSPKSVDRFKEILDFEADVLIERLEETNKRDTYFNPYEELQLCSLNIITTTCLARRFENTNDPMFRKINKFLHGSMIYAGVAGDVGSFIPSLSWLDVVTRKEKEMVDFVKNYRDNVYTKLVNDALDGDAECLVKSLYQMMDDQVQDDEEIRLDNDDILVFMSDFIGAGADTIAISLLWTFAVLSQKPEVQERIVRELDDWQKIHGHDQVPEFNEDRGDFPFMISVQKEILRFRPTTNFGIPHEASEELIIGDYVIPKGATLFSSMASMHMNPNFYKDPETFNPERFMNNTQQMARASHAKVSERDHFNFGWGRRICPGIHLAETEIFNVYVRLFSKFTIGPELDATGTPMYTNLNDFEDYGIVVKPLPFKACLIPRNKK